jgi:transposase
MTKDTVISGSGRRQWTTAQKVQIVEESLVPGASVAEVARRHNINPNLIYAWRRRPKTGAASSAAEGQSRFALVAVTAAGGTPRPIGNDKYDAGSMIEVVLRNGRVLRVCECATPARVAPLADALEECRS